MQPFADSVLNNTNHKIQCNDHIYVLDHIWYMKLTYKFAQHVIDKKNLDQQSAKILNEF